MTAPSTCTPCCNTGQMANSELSYRASSLELLCQLVADIEELIIVVGGSGVVLPQVVKAFGAVPAAYASLGILNSTKKLNRFYADNQTDANIEVSLDGGVTTAFTVFANSSLERELGAYVGAATTSVMIRYQAATVPSIGSAYFDGSY